MAIAAVPAVIDLWAVATDRRSIERWAKPAVMVFLIAAALLIPAESAAVRLAIVIGLALGLIGDVLLIPGAAAFLPGHIAYVVAMLLVPQEPRGLLVGGVVVLLVAVFVGRQIVAGAWRKSPLLSGVVAAYILVIGIVVVLAVVRLSRPHGLPVARDPAWLAGRSRKRDCPHVTSVCFRSTSRQLDRRGPGRSSAGR